MSYVADEYTRRARIYPMWIVFAPIFMTVAGLYTSGPEEAAVTIEKVIGSSVIVIVSFLFAMVGRDWGKKKQASLWAHWGGAPTTAALRFQGAPNKVLVERRHRQLEALIPGMRLPMSEEAEAKDPDADRKYETCIEFLKARTRDAKAYPLVFEENCHYGERRNLFGYKPLAVPASVAACIVFGLRVWWYYGETHGVGPVMGLVGLILSASLFAFWTLWVQPEWVRAAGVAYAERLLEACDTLVPPEAPAPRIVTSDR
jgi:hypothetical protein